MLVLHCSSRVPGFGEQYVLVSCFSMAHIIVRHLLRSSGTPVFYRNVILTLPKMDDGSPEVITKFEKVTQTTLRKVLDRQGCDVVQDPVSKEWVDFELLNLQDNMLLIAQRVSTPMDNRVRLITKR